VHHGPGAIESDRPDTGGPGVERDDERRGSHDRGDYDVARLPSMRVAMLTGGGDCPGLNAVMRAVVRKAERHFDDEVIGFLDGWKGVIESRVMPLSVETFRGALPRGGTLIGSSRTNPFKIDGGVEKCRASLSEHGVDALIAIGGED